RYRNVTGVQTCALPISTLIAKQIGWRKYRLTCLRYLGHGQVGRSVATVGIVLVQYKAGSSCPERHCEWWYTTRLEPQDQSVCVRGVGWTADVLRLAIVAAAIDQQPPVGQRVKPSQRLPG